MDFIWDILTNGALMASIISWTVAQVVKAILYNIKHKDWSLRRIHGAGGMPSAHSAMAVSAAIVIGRVDGFNAPIFALAVLFALIVIYDSTGVRAAVGEQAKLLNRMALRWRESGELPPEETPAPCERKGAAALWARVWSGKTDPGKRYEELLGHTMPEIAAGVAIGLAVGLLIPIA